jgi:hypothetical protein
MYENKINFFYTDIKFGFIATTTDVVWQQKAELFTSEK